MKKITKTTQVCGTVVATSLFERRVYFTLKIDDDIVKVSSSVFAIAVNGGDSISSLLTSVTLSPMLATAAYQGCKITATLSPVKAGDKISSPFSENGEFECTFDGVHSVVTKVDRSTWSTENLFLKLLDKEFERQSQSMDTPSML